jgi:hypothetical protein
MLLKLEIEEKQFPFRRDMKKFEKKGRAILSLSAKPRSESKLPVLTLSSVKFQNCQLPPALQLLPFTKC